MTTTPLVATPPRHYLFGNADAHARHLLHLWAQTLDPYTRQVLAGIAPRAGAVILDAGTGNGTVAQLMADTLLDGDGRVIALDIDPRHVPPHDRTTVQTADLTTADLGTATFDLIHARLLLTYLPARLEVLTRMVKALKPGGTLIVADYDYVPTRNKLMDASRELKGAYAAYQAAVVAIGQHGGLAPDWARYLPSQLRKHDLDLVASTVISEAWTGGQPALKIHACISDHLAPHLLAVGMSPCQLHVLRDGMADPDVTGYTYPLYTAIGVKPVR